tara:strand:+ start:1052 stop:1894 length:843 start_codon:yes stop_codon:yes gene_type:complete
MSFYLNTYDSFNHKFRDYNPIVIVTVVVVALFYYFVFSSLGSNSNTNSEFMSSVTTSAKTGSGMNVMELLFWGLLLFLIVINGLQYFFSLDINATIKNIFTSTPEIDINVDEKKEHKLPIDEIMFEKQVFHIPENKYTYDDAKALCKAYDARLATYNEVEDSYKNGGEWCSYGWSDNQLALFPTQKKTYDNLQKIKGHENDCGRPGINGGYIENKNVRFGVNCYGYKPEITPEEQELMQETHHYPITEKEKRLERKVEKYRRKLPNILVAPFNNKRWSII